MMEKTRLSRREIEVRKELAKTLFTKDGATTQKELAARVGISENTISKWVKEENWEKERASLTMTREAELRRFYQQVTALNDVIASRPKGEQFATPSEGDTLIKLSASIKNMETDVALADTIAAIRKLVSFVLPENLNDAKVITKWADLLIQTLLK